MRKIVNRTKQKREWAHPIWLVRSMTFESVVVAVFDDRDAANNFISKDPDLFLEESGLNNDYRLYNSR